MRLCENPACRKQLVRRARESDYHWERRRACSRPCAGVLGGATSSAKHKARISSAAEEERFCAFSKCATKLVRRYTESVSDFRSRRTCSRACAAQYVRESGGPAFMSRKKSSKAPCLSCAGLPHRRPIDGCHTCGGAFREESAA